MNKTNKITMLFVVALFSCANSNNTMLPMTKSIIVHNHLSERSGIMIEYSKTYPAHNNHAAQTTIYTKNMFKITERKFNGITQKNNNEFPITFCTAAANEPWHTINASENDMLIIKENKRGIGIFNKDNKLLAQFTPKYSPLN